MPPSFLFDGPGDAPITLLLAHGAGGAMDSAAMTALAAALASVGLRVARFEFGYMAARRTDGGRRPPPRAENLVPEYRAAVTALDTSGRLIIGGKSMGGRVASMVADELHGDGKVAGLLCLGYPFHPPGKPEQLRTGHLVALATPTLICQGTRDPFGTREDVAGYALSDRIDVLWVEDGDHNLRPRRRVTGVTPAAALQALADHVASWAVRITG
jgi:uncharacterized protein